MVCVAAVATGSATYAWFVNNSKVTADAGDYTASSAQYLLISHANEKNFKTSINFTTFKGEFVPVSTTDNTMGTFWQVDPTKANAWDNSKAKIFKTASAGTTNSDQAYTDTFELKSDQADVQVQCKITMSDDSQHLGSAVYVAFTGGNIPKSSPLVIQLSKDGTVAGGNNTYIGTSGNVSDSTDMTNNCTQKGIKDLNDSNMVDEANMDTLTVTNPEELTFNFDTLTTAATAQSYQMYIWLEGTDPQCYNPIAAKKLTGLNFEFSIPENNN